MNSVARAQLIKPKGMMEKLHVVHCHVHNNHDVIYGLESLIEEVHITKTMTMTAAMTMTMEMTMVIAMTMKITMVIRLTWQWQ